MRSLPSPRCVLFALACGTASASAWAQQPTRDTVVVIQRDTLVVIQRDTVYVAPAREEPTRPVAPTRSEEPEEDRYWTPGRGVAPSRDRDAGRGGERDGRPPAPGLYDRRAELEDARAARRARLEELRRERAERLGRLEDVRDSEHALAFYAYPTRLLEIDFPAATLGVAYVRDGRYGVMASAGVLTRPVNDFRDIPEGRGPVRGFDFGAEFRYYLGAPYNRFPMYVGGGGSYSWAPVTYERFVPVPERTFERFTAVDATGRRIRVSALIGWEFRGRGVAIDLTTGLEYHGRGIFTDDADLALALDSGVFNSTNRANQYNPGLYPIMRVGLGIGKW